ncbi:MAG: macro domain-containing protein [Erysipelotrichaceae bacterium]|nr:macro domain-containing protein [Erysipelotrichaceae bacterium]
MPLSICRNDILKIRADAIVDPTDCFLSGSGGTDLQIHTAAGEKLNEECLNHGFLETGEVFVTPSYDCKNCDYIIHTCGPVFDGENEECDEQLRSCYRNSLNAAAERGLESVAFPLISSGSFAYPKGKALRIATDTITSFLLDHEMQVYLLVYDKEAFDTASKLFVDIRNYLQEQLEPRYDSISYNNAPAQHYATGHRGKPKLAGAFEKIRENMIESLMTGAPVHEKEEPSFEPDESFSQCLIRLIDEKGMKDPDVYKRANIDRKLFNHIKNDVNYHPKKETAVALAIGMRLNLREANDLLEKAGFVLSRSSRFDLVIRYCLEHNIYNIFKINEYLFAEDQKTLGC